MDEVWNRLKVEIKKVRTEEAENLALGYGGDDYRFRVGIIHGYDDVLAFAEKIIRDINNGK